MKMVSNWLETMVAGVEIGKKNSVLYLVILAVLLLGAFSLYILLNSTS